MNTDPIRGRLQVKERGGAPLTFDTIADQQVVYRSGYTLDGLGVSSPIVISGGNIAFDGSVALTNNARVSVNKNSGATVGTRRRINFIEGANITLTISDDAGNEEVDVTIAASGGGGGSGNSVTATLAFGASFTDKAQTVVTGQAWVTANSEIVVQVKTPSGVDPDEMRLLDFRPVISDLVAGTGFTVTLYSEPEAKGDYDVMCVGV